MIFPIITLLTALAMATTAAVFAVFGIVAIFAGMPTFALVMGTVIELGKVVGVSWIYRNWTEPTKIKYFMLPLVFVAMLLTSMGIFGLLSKAHLDQTQAVGSNSLVIERLDQQIAREQTRIDNAEQVVSQLDETVNTLIEFSRISGPDGARAVREGQEEQRTELTALINTAQDKIDELQTQRLELQKEVDAVELEVGPVLYIAQLIYEDGEERLEDAVRWVIIAFIFVFDPMAIMLLIAANYSLMSLKREEQKSKTNVVIKGGKKYVEVEEGEIMEMNSGVGSKEGHGLST